MYKLLDDQFWNKIDVNAGDKKRKAMPEEKTPKEEPQKKRDHLDLDVILVDKNKTKQEPHHCDAIIEDQNKPKEKPGKDDHRDATPEDQNKPKEKPDKSVHPDQNEPKEKPDKNDHRDATPEDQNKSKKKPDKSVHPDAIMEDQNEPKEKPDKNDHRDATPEDQNTPKKKPDKSVHPDAMLEDQNEPKEKPDKSDRKKSKGECKEKVAKIDKRPMAKASAKAQAKVKPTSKIGIVKKDLKKDKHATKKMEKATTTEDPSEMNDETLKKKLHSVSSPLSWTAFTFISTNWVFIFRLDSKHNLMFSPDWSQVYSCAYSTARNEGTSQEKSREIAIAKRAECLVFQFDSLTAIFSYFSTYKQYELNLPLRWVKSNGSRSSPVVQKWLTMEWGADLKICDKGCARQLQGCDVCLVSNFSGDLPICGMRWIW